MKSFKNLEWKRKGFHVLGGLVLTFFVWNGTVTPLVATLLIVIAFLIAYQYRTNKRDVHPFLNTLFELFAREEEKRGKLPALSLLSTLVATLFLVVFAPRDIAVAALLVLFVGDPASYLVGATVGRVRLPWNEKKHLEGVLAGTVVATLAILWLVPFWHALLAAFAAMLLESVPLRVGPEKVDDNFLIPIVAAAALTGFALV